MQVNIIPSSQIPPSDEIASQVEVDSTAAALTPDLAQSAEAVREKLIASGISEKDVADACAWARQPKE